MADSAEDLTAMRGVWDSTCMKRSKLLAYFFLQLPAPVALLHSCVLLVTCLRLYIQAKRGKFWFDDGAALLALVAFLAHMVPFQICLSYAGASHCNLPLPGVIYWP